MHLDRKRQDSTVLGSFPSKIPSPLFPSAPLGENGEAIYTTTATSFFLSTQVNGKGEALNTWTTSAQTVVLTLPGLPPIASATPTSTTFASSASTVATSIHTAPPQQPSSSSKSLPLSTLIPAIVVPIVVVALVAPIILYFCLTRHDRQRRKSQIEASRVSSRAYQDPQATQGSRAEVKSPSSRDYSSDTQNTKASEIMNFDLTPVAEKALPVVSVTSASEKTYEPRPRPRTPGQPKRPDRSEHAEAFEVRRGVNSDHNVEAFDQQPRNAESPIGQAISRYSGTHDSLTLPQHDNSLVAGNHDSLTLPIEGQQNRTSIQELSEENMRIARLATDSRASFGARDLDEISDVSAPGERTSRHLGRRGVDELSDVSSIYDDDDDDDDAPARVGHGEEIFGNPGARRSGPLR